MPNVHPDLVTARGRQPSAFRLVEQKNYRVHALGFCGQESRWVLETATLIFFVAGGC
jgi:hypothetical protein